MALTLISAADDLDSNGLSYGLIIWRDTNGLFHAKASRPPVREDTGTFATAAAAATAARSLASTMN